MLPLKLRWLDAHHHVDVEQPVAVLSAADVVPVVRCLGLLVPLNVLDPWLPTQLGAVAVLRFSLLVVWRR